VHKGQVQAWALNRYYYKAMIRIRNANPDRALRRSGALRGTGAAAWSITTAKASTMAASPRMLK